MYCGSEIPTFKVKRRANRTATNDMRLIRPLSFQLGEIHFPFFCGVFAFLRTNFTIRLM